MMRTSQQLFDAWLRPISLAGMALLLLAALGLSACGGGGGDGDGTGVADEGDDVTDSAAPDVGTTGDGTSDDVTGGVTTVDVSDGPGDSDGDGDGGGFTGRAINGCGGLGDLLWQGEAAMPGETCGPFGEGALVCGGLDVLRCVGQASVNMCGSRGDLAVEIGTPCGVCAGIDEDGAGTWVCGADGEPMCVGARDPNGCGGCAALDGRPGGACADGEGRLTCASREVLACEDAVVNACGGSGVLRYQGQPVLPGDACDAGCGTGVLVCSDMATGAVECVAGNFGTPVNECGSCSTLPGQVGETCGPCGGGSWACDGEGGMLCLGPISPDACGDCSERTERPGQPCEAAGIWLCSGVNLTCGDVVRPEDRNACGGAEVLEDAPGSACGECGGGVHICATPNSVACVADTERNACGGCGPLIGVQGQRCGECGSGELVCSADNTALECDGDLGADARNACGRCSELPVDLGDSCGTCLEWACGKSGGVRCEVNATLPGCDFDTCDGLDCEGEARSCIPSNGIADAECDLCLPAFVDVSGMCVPAADAVDPCTAIGVQDCDFEATVIGTAGGTVTLALTGGNVGSVTLLVPAGSMPPNTTVTIAALSPAESENVAPEGYGLASPVLIFSPAGLSFDPPITVQVSYRPVVDNPTLFWTVPGSETTYAPLVGTLTPGRITAVITHFSRAFVGDVLPECTVDVDCGEDEVCDTLNGICVPATADGGGDADGADGTSDDPGGDGTADTSEGTADSDPDPGDGADGSDGTGDTGGGTCTDNGECDAGEICDPVDGICVPAGGDGADGTDDADGDPCIPTTCELEMAACGTLPNGCGGTLDCGGCTEGETCESNLCVEDGGQGCDQGFVDCGGSCADLDRDPNNCGFCGNDCGGNDCIDGFCDEGGGPNACGGTGELDGSPGENCDCGGNLQCDGTEALVCVGATPPNSCGGCEPDPPGAVLGGECEEEGTWVCSGDALECSVE